MLTHIYYFRAITQETSATAYLNNRKLSSVRALNRRFSHEKGDANHCGGRLHYLTYVHRYCGRLKLHLTGRRDKVCSMWCLYSGELTVGSTSGGSTHTNS